MTDKTEAQEREELAQWLLNTDVGPHGADDAVKLERIAALLRAAQRQNDILFQVSERAPHPAG